MKRQSEKYRLGIMSELNITPLLDLAFVLLIIFVITSPFLAESADQQISSNSDQNGEAIPGIVATVSISDTRQLTLDGAPVTTADLGSVLTLQRQRSKTPDDFGVRVEAHRELPVHDLLNVMAQIKNAGVEKVSVIEQKQTVADATPKQ